MKNVLYFLIVLLVFSTTQNLHSDNRGYVWTYEYMIMERGTSELEQYTTFKIMDMDDVENTSTSELNFEFETGMTDHFDFAVYQNFKQDNDGNFIYDGFKLRARFKIGEKDKYFLDPLIYIEYKNKANFSKHTFEPKLILAKDIGNFNFALNPYMEIEQEDDEWEIKPKYAAGFRFNFSELFGLGLEFKGDEHAHYVCPTVSHGNHKMYSAIGALFGYSLDEDKQEFQLRLILGFLL